jgi:hypothetical protein
MHDEYSHGADMYRYAAQAVELMGAIKSEAPDTTSTFEPADDGMGMLG